MIKDALDKGCRKFIICIGGSATNDGGMGMLKALGYRFYDINHREVSNNGLGLKDLYSIDNSEYDKRLDDCHFTVASDVTNPLCGINGASYVFARQKGANDEIIALMDKWLENYAAISGFDPDIKGAGAAGGLGFALKHYLNAQMLKGIDLVIKYTGIEEIIKDVDLVICGEVRLIIRHYLARLQLVLPSWLKNIIRELSLLVDQLNIHLNLMNTSMNIMKL